MIRALVFDFDGLILDTETALIDAWAELHRRAGHPYARADAHRLVGHVGVDFDPWAAFGPGADHAALDAAHRRLTREFTQRQTALPGVSACLAAARELGLRLGIASNSSHGHVEGHLARLQLLDCFDAICCREDVPEGKPAPDLYLAALSALGATGPEAVALEDSAPGVLAAKRAGLWCVAVPNPSTQGHDLRRADLRLRTLVDQPLPRLLAQLAG